MFLAPTRVPAVHYPVLHSWSLSFKHKQMAHQRLLRSWSNQGWIIILHTQREEYITILTVIIYQIRAFQMNKLIFEWRKTSKHSLPQLKWRRSWGGSLTHHAHPCHSVWARHSLLCALLFFQSESQTHESLGRYRTIPPVKTKFIKNK